MASEYKLTYFDFAGLGEPIRYLFLYGGIDFEDNRISRESWPALKPKTPFGQMPLLEHNGKAVGQSTAIARYVGKLIGLSGKDEWENLEIDFIVDSFNDFKTKASQAAFETDETLKAKLLETLKNETAPFYLDRFEEIAKKNNGHLVGGHLTWADIYVGSFLDLFKTVNLNPTENRPNLTKIRDTVLANKNIQEYRKNHPNA